jgi:hypothetical protein
MVTLQSVVKHGPWDVIFVLSTEPHFCNNYQLKNVASYKNWSKANPKESVSKIESKIPKTYLLIEA